MTRFFGKTEHRKYKSDNAQSPKQGGDSSDDAPAQNGKQETANQNTDRHFTDHLRNNSTSIGTKLVFVCITAVISLLPLLLVSGALEMRDRYASGIIKTLENKHGGQQRVTGPVIIVPTKWTNNETSDSVGKDQPARTVSPPTLVFTPQTLSVKSSLATTLYRESVYGVIGYDAGLDVQANFNTLTMEPVRLGNLTPDDISISWGEARVVYYVSDSAALGFQPDITINGNKITFSPDSLLLTPTQENTSYPLKNAISGRNLQGFSSNIGKLINHNEPNIIKTNLSLNGATNFTITPLGRQTNIAFLSNIAPKMITGIPGQNNKNGNSVFTPKAGEQYTNNWSLAGPYSPSTYSRFLKDVNSPLLKRQDLKVSFGANNIRPYKDIHRALRYGFFLMGFSFLTFFVFDAVSKRYLHSAQYFLLGLIQTIFYTLLLGISEFTGFDRGFLIAAIPTIAVTGIAIASILRSAVLGILAVILFAAFYAVQYILMDMAQYSLLVAAGAAFLAISASLIATSRLEWGRFSKAETASRALS